MKEEKNILRKRLFELRNSLSAEEVEQRSKCIIEKLRGIDAFQNVQSIFCYVSFDNEVKTLELLQACISMGKQVSVPLALVRERRLVPYEVHDLQTELKRGHWGILEPDKNLCRAIDKRDIKAAVIPGLGFDRQRDRLGYGLGFFDRLLADLDPNALKIGLAFDFQVLERLPTEWYDRKMDMIVTEAGIIG